MNQAVMTMAAKDDFTKEMYALNQVTKASTNMNNISTGIGHAEGYAQNCCMPQYNWWPYEKVVVHSPSIIIEDKTKKAFAIAKKFLKMKWAKADKIEDFIEFVEAIEKEL